MAILNRPATGVRPIAEASVAGLLTASVIYIFFNEGLANWQSWWSCLAWLGFAATMWLARDAQNQE
jgi:hypothetical protein